MAIPQNIAAVWNEILNSIRATRIHLIDSSIEIIWALTAHGHYTPKLGYQNINSLVHQGDMI